MGPTNGGIVETPTLDIETPGILQRVSEEGGGYTFARMAAAARDGDARAAEVAREMAWEQLHCGPWHSVLPIWRDAYSMACLHVAKHHFAGGDFSETIRVLDLGLIMGGTLLRVDLENAVDKVMAVLEERENGSNNGEGSDNGGGLLFSSADFNEAEVLRSLPANSLSSKLVARRSGLSLEGFLRDYFLMGLPVIISDSMSHWPARARWNNMEYLKRVAGGRTVPVEVGKNYLCSEWKQELITFSQFLERIQSGSTCAAPTYLAQHPLFEQIKELRKDILVPDYCYAGGGELRSINAWFGPAGTVTPLHHDPHHNLLAQVVGKKYVRLYAASLSEELYPHSETMLRNSSQIDLDDIDDNAFPKVRDLEFMDCILDEGDMLYIPPKWWHYVRSLTPSLSVSFWWSNPEGSP
ncbi:lysine-specific demethylase JMJ30-like [Chenopodium quinoa]|uniref:lysine-specific demethylase JMJ30-like n=1 Tax=Chenopodium quinoa TaxID=63459 RepID=UPI000B79964F|nr:lysine-specific demethylase JMJ30-like [Chenopodium quinoa]XP_021728929.1 lysine-specific demethylase JMJ30-like [Chenopodium quinoa]